MEKKAQENQVKAQIQKSFRASFVAKEEDLRKLHTAFAAFGPDVTYTIECLDEISLTFESVEELLKYENEPARRITSLSIRTWGGSGGLRDRVWLQLKTENRYDTNAYIDLEGHDKKVIKLNREIEKRLAAMRPWYDSKINIAEKIGGTAPYLFGAMMGVLVFTTIVLSEAKKIDPKLLMWGKRVAITAGILIILIPVLRFAKRAFPIGTFVIGQGVERYKREEQVRSALTALMVSIVAGLLVALLLMIR